MNDPLKYSLSTFIKESHLLIIYKRYLFSDYCKLLDIHYFMFTKVLFMIKNFIPWFKP